MYTAIDAYDADALTQSPVRATVRQDGRVLCQCGRFLIEIDGHIEPSQSEIKFAPCKSCRQMPVLDLRKGVVF